MLKRSSVLLGVAAAVAIVGFVAVGEEKDPFASRGRTTSVEVTNFPETQAVTGTVTISNLPGGQAQFVFVGVTTETFLGNAGKVAMNQACYAQYPGSRMAFTEEYSLTINAPAVPEVSWIQPRGVIAINSGSDSVRIMDAAGNFFDGGPGGFRLHCSGWSSTNNDGVVVWPTGRFEQNNCDGARPVACAAPAGS